MINRERTAETAGGVAMIAMYLDGLSALAGQSFASTQVAIEATLELISDQLGLRTSYLTEITPEQQLSQVLAAYNAPGGCDVAPGALLSLPETF